MTSQQLISLIEPILYATLQNTITDMIRWILKYVPRRTGQLRDTLIKSMKSSRVQNGMLKFIVGTHVQYANKVNQMSTSQVQHNSWFEHSGHRAYAYYYNYKHRGTKVGKRKMKIGKRYKGPSHYRIFLSDPDAVGMFWDTLLVYLRLRVLYHLRNTMLFQYGKTQLPWVIN